MQTHESAYTYAQYGTNIGHGQDAHSIPPLDTTFNPNQAVHGSGGVGYAPNGPYGNQFMPTSISPEQIHSNSGVSMTEYYSNSNSTYPPAFYDKQGSPAGNRATGQQGMPSGQGYIPSSSGSGYHNDNSRHATPQLFSAPGRASLPFGSSGGSQVARSAPVNPPKSRTDYARSLSESSMSGYPLSEPGDLTKPADGGFVATSAPYSVTVQPEMLHATHPPAAPSRASNKSSGNKKREFWCRIQDCPHARPFGTRNDLDRHKFSVHRIPTDGQKVYICQGDTCVNSGKQREWPRKDNFKNHCKVAHSQEDTDDLVRRSEKMSSPKAHEDGPNGNDRKPCQRSPSAQPHSPSSSHHHHPHPHNHHQQHQHHHHEHGRFLPEIQISPSQIDSTTKYDVPMEEDGSASSPSPSDSSSLPQRADLAFPDCCDIERDAATDASTHYKRRASKIEKELEDASLSTETRKFLLSVLGKRRHSGAFDRVEDEIDTRHVCSTCGKEFPRRCDLKKHEERHTRRWGCTDAACDKRFGSKNDWKRHENLVHFQREMWVCGEQPMTPKQEGKQRCVHVFHSLSKFRQHLEVYHKINHSADVTAFEKKLNHQRVGRQGAGSMWCGFCEEVRKLRRLDTKQWEERFDHIDYHYKRGEAIEDWFPPDSDVPKRLMPDRGFGMPALSNARDTAFPAPKAIDAYPQHADVQNDIPIDPALTQIKSSPRSTLDFEEPHRKRRATTAAMTAVQRPADQSTAPVVYCCKCGIPTNPTIEVGCPSCNHTVEGCNMCR